MPGGRRVGARSGLQDLGAELVTHVDVGGQVDSGQGVRHALHLCARGQHLITVRGEMQVGSADSACLHRHQHLAGPGHRFGHVVAHHHRAVAQYRGAHQFFSPAVSEAASVMALTMACPARPSSWSRMPLAQSWDARGALSCPLKWGMTSRANSS